MGFINVYSRATGEKHRVPKHFMDHPTLKKPFRLTPKQRATDDAAAESATPATDVATATSATPTTETPAAGAKE
ncbi:hypothetical protein [Nocardioides sp. SYSU DS0663]|uniref:hypothetical protein n=1 Tax=Nocardioides sp. SYSU DS0663 TaxID=3416445 RepID=UPI003F4B053F